MTGNPQVLSPSAVQRCTFFDLMAVICHQIQELPEDRQESIYRNFSAGYSGYCQSVRERFPFLADDGGRPALYYYRLERGQAELLLGALNAAESDRDWALLLAAVEALDRIIELKPNLEHFLGDKPCPAVQLGPKEPPCACSGYHQFDSLNPATRDYGLLLPRAPCQWQRPSTRSMGSVGFRPLSVMKNYLWVRPGLGYRIVNLYADFGLSPGRRLKVAASPLCSQAPFLLHCRPENSTFEVQYLPAGTEKINAQFEKALYLCAEEQADIAIFPEMLASPASLRHCAQYVRSHWEWDMPKLILLPTCEYMDGQGWVNEWVALDADGHGLFAYHKQHPFRFERKPVKGRSGREPPGPAPTRPEFFDEPIQPDRTLYLLHVPGIGRIGFLICSDVFREGYLDVLLQELKVTLLLHTVYSPGADLLERMLATAQRHLCDVVVCNTCAAWDNPLMAPEERPLVEASGRALLNKYYPYGHKDCRPLPGTTGCRQGECPGCVFVMEVADRYDGRQIPVSRRFG